MLVGLHDMAGKLSLTCLSCCCCCCGCGCSCMGQSLVLVADCYSMHLCGMSCLAQAQVGCMHASIPLHRGVDCRAVRLTWIRNRLPDRHTSASCAFKCNGPCLLQVTLRPEPRPHDPWADEWMTLARTLWSEAICTSYRRHDEHTCALLQAFLAILN
jgi:hypothetical protein